MWMACLYGLQCIVYSDGGTGRLYMSASVNIDILKGREAPTSESNGVNRYPAMRLADRARLRVQAASKPHSRPWPSLAHVS